ncbi:MAG TPA: LytTR family DNA-binding domain-containing protein [Allosphingosinicella sp.]
MLLPAFLRRDFRPGRRVFYGAALAILFVAYSLVLALTGNWPLSRVIANALANVVPIALLGLASRQVIRSMADKPLVTKMVGHLALGLVFTIAWFWLLMVLLGAVAGRNAIEFSVRPFLGPAATWQLFQGLTVYAAITVAVHAEMLAERSPIPAPEREGGSASSQPPRLFVKHEEELRPLDTDRIILIRGADDYSEIVTPTGTHLVRISLASLDERLGERFLRVHRSCLVNVDRISRVEPEGGGRMLVHMDSGEMIRTSRAGSRLLRDRVI